MEVAMLLSILRRLNKPFLVACMVLFSHVSVSAGVTDLRLSTAQIFDVQWNISGGKLNASGFNYIYSSVNYATQTTSAARWTSAQTADAGANGRYISFFNSTTNPGTYGMAVYNSDGSVYKIVNNTGSFRALADGAIFYNGNNMWGTLITTGQGYNLGQSGSWTVTQDRPSNAQLEAYTPPSSTPLAPGETAQTSAPPPPPPTPVYSSSISAAQSSRVSKVQVNPQGHNAEVNITGSSNDIHIEQAGSPNYILLNVLGNSNKVDATQTASGGAHMYNETMIIGDRNDLTLLQTGTTNKTAFVSITGNDNAASVIQKDSGQHYLQLDITGNNHNASVLQQGTGSHNATVTLDGSQPWNFGLTQSGATGQTYSLPHAMSDGASVSGTCSAVGGCNLLVNQQ
jgi:hypothetical protein